MNSKLGKRRFSTLWLILRRFLAASLTVFLFACTAAPTSSSSSTTEAPAKEIVLYNWPDYMPQSVLDKFEKEYGTKVIVQTYNSQEEAIGKISNGEIQYDIAVIEYDLLPSLVSRSLLAEINYRNIPNFENVSANFRDLSMDPGNRYSVPYNWGTSGLIVRSDPSGRPYEPALFIAGERTGEKGTELFGEICPENRGVMRFDVIARGAKGHSGLAGTGDLSEKLIAARSALSEIFSKHLTLKSSDGWQSQAKFPFINVGTTGVYNVTAAEGILGVEIRPIPQDDVEGLKSKVGEYCEANGLELRMNVMENGVACDKQNPALLALIQAVKNVSGEEPRIGRKLPGTSARFAPGGQAVVWGQTGIGPHAKEERHYIPSIEPYYKSLNELAKLWK